MKLYRTRLKLLYHVFKLTDPNAICVEANANYVPIGMKHDRKQMKRDLYYKFLI